MTNILDQEDYGWKLIHGDVFRFPPFKSLFCAFIGLGFQSLAIMFALLLLALVGVFYPNNGGTLYTAAIVLYALTSGTAFVCLCNRSVLGGFVSASFYKQFNGDKWAWNVVLVGTLYSVPLLVVFSFVNTVAVVYEATAAVPIGSILIVLAITVGGECNRFVSYETVGMPLNVVGGIAGRRAAGAFEAPCRTKNFPREIPPIPWYRSLPCQIVMSGFLPFRFVFLYFS